MLTKKEIEHIKSVDLEQLYKVIQEYTDEQNLLFILSNLGRLPAEFDGQLFVPHLQHSNPQIRLWAVKNIGKLSDETYLVTISNIAYGDKDTVVRREAVSTIGRMRNETAIPILISLLSDSNPEIILQAIRALLVFKQDKTVIEELKQLSNHPNELIQTIIRQDCFSSRNGQPSPKYPHAKFPDFMKNTIVHGDVQEILRFVPDEAIHLTFTSPPYYNARSYSTYPSYKAYLEFLKAVFEEVYRVTKEGRFLIVNTSPVIMPRVSRKHSSVRYAIPFDLHSHLAQIGWTFIDDIIWAKPETTAKNRNAGFLQHRKPLGYKPNATTEYVMVYRKQTDKLIDWNMQQYSEDIIEESKIQGDYETSNLWKIDPTFDKIHSAVFPLELCNRIIKFYSYKEDLVFDPFGGSGTLGQSAINLSRYFFMTEQKKEYVERIKERLMFTAEQPSFLTIKEFKNLQEKCE